MALRILPHPPTLGSSKCGCPTRSRGSARRILSASVNGQGLPSEPFYFWAGLLPTERPLGTMDSSGPCGACGRRGGVALGGWEGDSLGKLEAKKIEI